MSCDLHGITLTHITYQLNINCLINLTELKTNIFPLSKIRKNNLLFQTIVGTISISGFGYLTVHITRHIIYSILHIEKYFSNLVKLITPSLTNYLEEPISGLIKTTNIHSKHKINSNSIKQLLNAILFEFPNIVILARQSNCTETPFLITKTKELNTKLTYLLKNPTNFTLKIYPSGQISIITKTFSNLESLLKKIKHVI